LRKEPREVAVGSRGGGQGGALKMTKEGGVLERMYGEGRTSKCSRRVCKGKGKKSRSVVFKKKPNIGPSTKTVLFEKKKKFVQGD